MIRQLIADDEFNVRRGIREVLSIGKLDFDILGEIKEGGKTLEEARERKVNILRSREKFMREWINGKIKSSELERKMEYYNVPYSRDMGIIVVKVLDEKEMFEENTWQRDLLCYGIVNIAKELMTEFKYSNIFVDEKMQIVIVSDTTPIRKWQEVGIELENNIKKYLNIDVVIDEAFLRKEPIETNIVYKILCNRLYEKSKKTHSVIEVQKYIDKNYSNESLSISKIAEQLEMSQNYIVRLFKKETGMTFSDYLTNTRIRNAIMLMRDKTLDIEDIAKLVGYSTKSYFSSIFKKNVGISPVDYKAGVNNYNN